MFEELLELYKTKAEEIEKERKEAQGMLMLVSAIEKISRETDSKKSDVELLGRLIDQVDRLSKEVSDLKSQLRTRQGRPAPVQETSSGDGKALDNHARSLIDIMAERPGRYTTSELVDMLGLNKTTVISVMKRALELDPKHVKMSQGTRRKLYLAYISEDGAQIAETTPGSGESDRAKLELMAMT
jgi:DNA-binding transcriptional regulator GbsR (MarR family)